MDGSRWMILSWSGLINSFIRYGRTFIIIFILIRNFDRFVSVGGISFINILSPYSRIKIFWNDWSINIRIYSRFIKNCSCIRICSFYRFGWKMIAWITWTFNRFLNRFLKTILRLFKTFRTGWSVTVIRTYSTFIKISGEIKERDKLTELGMGEDREYNIRVDRLLQNLPLACQDVLEESYLKEPSEA